MTGYSFDAVIFDLDGVVTKTASIHSEAWKRVFDEYLKMRERRYKEKFKEFTHDKDYLPYVDGKPRYDGVKGFLRSRGIDIPYGDPSDSPDKETICGIGNKKNKVFCELLKQRGAEIYPSSIEFIKSLRQAGIRTGIASSSKNCKLILEATHIEDLFETRVDGVVSVELGLKGKPEGDIFVTAARNLDTTPERAVVVEDATSGVEAGRNGGFGLVLGVARKGNKSELLKNGADIAVDDLSEVDIDTLEQHFHRVPKPLFKSWDEFEDMVKKPAFFLDYDGTLTPIVERPELACMSDEMREALERLSKRSTIAIISGRMREDVESLVKIKDLIYAGSHGFDIKGPDFSMIQPQAKQAMPVIAKVIEELLDEIGNIKNIIIERKKLSVAVHYRLVDEKYIPKIKSTVDSAVKRHKSLRIMNGKKVFEVLPDIEWDKGKAIRWIMESLGLSWSDLSVIYIGDDVTDEFAFRIVRGRGIPILVAQQEKASWADYQLFSVDEVKRFFERFL